MISSPNIKPPPHPLNNKYSQHILIYYNQEYLIFFEGGDGITVHVWSPGSGFGGSVYCSAVWGLGFRLEFSELQAKLFEGCSSSSK